MYAAHDARFDPLEVVHLAGELLAAREPSQPRHHRSATADPRHAATA